MTQWIAGIGTRHTFDQFMNALRSISVVMKDEFQGQITMNTSVGYGSRPQVRFAFKPDMDINVAFEQLAELLGKDYVRQVELCICPEGRW